MLLRPAAASGSKNERTWQTKECWFGENGRVTPLGKSETKERTGKVILQKCSWWAGGWTENNANQRKGPKYPSEPGMLNQVVKAEIFVHFCYIVFTMSCLRTSRNWWKDTLSRRVGSSWDPSLVLPSLIVLPGNWTVTPLWHSLKQSFLRNYVIIQRNSKESCNRLSIFNTTWMVDTVIQKEKTKRMLETHWSTLIFKAVDCNL